MSGPTWRFSRSWRAGVGLQLPVRDSFSTILPELAGLPTRVPSRPHSRCVGCPGFMNPSDEGVEGRWYCDNNRIASC